MKKYVVPALLLFSLFVMLIPLNSIKVKADITIPPQKVDISMMVEAFGSSVGSVRWNPYADLNNDSVINMKDVALLAKWYGNNTNFEIHPQISMYYWAYVDMGRLFEPDDAQVISDMQTIKSLNCTSVIVADFGLDLGTYNSEPSLYRSSFVLQECQKIGLDVIINFDPWIYVIKNTGSGRNPHPELFQEGGYTSDLFLPTLHVLQNFYRLYGNFIGFIFDDTFIPEQKINFDTTLFENTVRSNFDIGRPYFLYFVSSYTQLSTSIVGDNLDSVACDYYWESLNSAYNLTDEILPNSTTWISDINTAYSSKNNLNYTITLVLDASEERVNPDVWMPQLKEAESHGMLGIIWYAWNMSRTAYCIENNTSWWSTISQINQQFLEYLS